ncbi:MAG: M48 family metallopeptidase [Patescibacteria group bacterium]
MYESFITYLRRISHVSSARKKQRGKNFLEHKEQARRLAKERIEHFNKMYQFEFNRVSIRNQRTRWGSCSSKRNLNFNYKIALLPLPLADYIIVHELCHLGEFNHSKKFWELVAKTIPNHREIRKVIRKNGISFY